MMKIKKNRLEAFSDGVMAIIVTIMVLNIPLPSKFELNDILSFLASILVFFISFFIVGFFWHQHYRMFHDVEEISGKISWRNLLFLFFLSLLPIFTKWVVNNFGEVVPAVGYVIVFLLVNLSNQFMFSCLITDEDKKKWNSVRKFFWIRLVVWVIFIAGAMVLSFFFPRVASVIMIGLPLLISLSNLWFENDKSRQKRHNKDKRHKEEPPRNITGN